MIIRKAKFVEYEENAKKPRIIYTGESYPRFNGVEYVNFKDLGKYLNECSRYND